MSLIIALMPLCVYSIINDLDIFGLIQPGIDQLFHFSLRDKAINLINDSYDQFTSNILNLFLFNIKQDYGYDLYQNMIDLSIVYLIVISGFHLSFIQNIFKHIFKNHRWLNQIVNNCFVFIYTYLLSFSISSTRVLLSNSIGIIKLKYEISPYTKVSLAGILSLIICPSSIGNYGFSMSYLCTIGVIFIYELKIKNWLINTFCVNSLATFISLPYVLVMNEQISIFAIINSILFSYFICGIFVIVLITFWIKWIYPFQYYLVVVLSYIVNGFGTFNLMIQLPNWNNTIIIFYSSILLSGLLIYSKLYGKLN